MIPYRRLGFGVAVAIPLLASALPLPAKADPVETVLHNFTNAPDGSLPNASVLVKGGAVYGVSPYGAKAQGFTGSGLVFRLSPPAAGQKQWSEAFIHSFGAAAGGVIPVGQLIVDKQGALYGVTMSGGSGKCSCGTVFKLTPPASASEAWSRQVIHSFQDGSDGADPESGLTLDSRGALYGTTTYGGGYNDGVVFMLTPPTAGKTQWTKTTIFEFTGAGPIGSSDSRPRGRLLVKNGSVYGTTTGGTVFKLTPPAKGKTAWTETILFGFKNGKDGGDPEGGVIMDANGALYGMTEKGGIDNCSYNGFQAGCGVIYKLTPPAKGALWKETVLHRFASGSDGANPLGELLMDAKGALYGTTSNGGTSGCTISGVTDGCGTIYRLAPSGTAWTETVLYRFPETMSGGHLYYPQGIEPLDGLVADAGGNLYGTANVGGTGGVGVVFKLAGSGYAVH